tara:strand:+ start:37809 stop:40136 length:2328 start_codon:yes stop_codon:yes gene_type:complete
MVLGSVLALLFLEWRSPLRRAPAQIRDRWLTNLGLMALGGVIVGALFPTGIEQIAADMPAGWVSQWQLPLALEALLVFLLLDGWRYWEHRVFHEVPLLWRTHLVHHSDTHIDITTAERHHPLEAILAVSIAMLLVFAFGFSVQALAVYLFVATLSALFTHSNFDLPERIDRPLRRILVTPSVHALHHSDQQQQTDSNYGTVLTLWDRLFGTYTDPSTVPTPRFGLEYFHERGDLSLAPTLLQPFEYRRSMAHSPRDDGPLNTAHATALSPLWRQTLRNLSAAVALLILAMWPTVSGLAGIYNSSEAYQYAWLVLPMFAYVVGWYHRERILALAPSADFLGLAVVVIALGIWSFAYIVDIRAGQHLALVLALQGIALAALGRAVYRDVFPIMAMLFMLIPCGDILQPLLRDLTVKWIEWFAIITGLPHEVDGFVIFIGEQRYVVVDACSGLTFVTLGGFLGYCFGVLIYQSFPRTVALAALGAALGMLTNALRVWMIVSVDWLRGSQMDMAGHMDLQWLALIAALGLLFYITARLADGPPAHSAAAAMPAKDLPAKPSTTALMPVFAAITALAVTLPLQRLPTSNANTAQDTLAELAVLYGNSGRWVSASREQGRALLIQHSERIELLLTQSSSLDGRVDESLLRPTGNQTWRHAHSTQRSDCNQNDCLRFNQHTWQRKGSDDKRHAVYLYYVGSYFTESKLQYRIRNGWQRITLSGEDSGMVAVKVRGALPDTAALRELLVTWRAGTRLPTYAAAGDVTAPNSLHKPAAMTTLLR